MGYSPRGRKESDMTKRLHLHFHTEGKEEEEKKERKRKRRQEVIERREKKNLSLDSAVPSEQTMIFIFF